MAVAATVRRTPEPIARAGAALALGEPVLIFDADDREGETDLVFLSERATPELVRLQRSEAGGLICTALSEVVRAKLALPFQSEMLDASAERFPVLRPLAVQQLRYDARSAFGVTVNHRTNFTGVPDNDRATTIQALGALAAAAPRTDARTLQARFVSEFTSPGHVPLLYAAPGLVRERKGHTELAISLARMGGLSESVTVCEMLGDSGGPRAPEAARRYAREHGWNFLEGHAITEAFIAWSA